MAGPGLSKGHARISVMAEQETVVASWRTSLPGRVLSRLFSRRFLEALTQAHHAGRLRFFGHEEPVRTLT